MRIAVLGPLEVRTDAGDPVEVAGVRLRTVLVRLALDVGRVVTTAQLIDAVWAQEPPAAAANALQALVSRLRRASPDLVVESHPAGYRLALDPGAVDASEFEALLRRARREPDEAAQCRQVALALWRGPALAEFEAADFARGPAARLTELRLSTVEDVAASGEANPADLEALNRAYPTRERLAVLLMRALQAGGRPADALTVFERTRVAIADELGADPSPELTALHRELLRAPEPAAPTTGPSNVRSRLTTFVGRDRDVKAVADLVGPARLVTLVGPGGSGKTRLALECAAELVDRYPDGVWLVELAAVTDPAELATTVLGALGLREQTLLAANLTSTSSPNSPLWRLVRALRDKRLLIVLDNCEHLVDAAAALAEEVLGRCDGLRILATSREPLALTGETLWTVEPLGVPPAGAGPVTALAFPAVRLLADRAAAARPGFVVDATTVGPVVDLCRALDGLPLAIELAAARLRTMTVGQVAQRLDDRFQVLVAGSRTALPRHQTLRAVVDWSWDLLSAQEQTLWRRLAILPGGANGAALDDIGDLGTSTRDIAYGLAEKSLVVVTGEDEPRFGLLETVRAYGLERLVESGEAAAVRARYLNHYLRLAESAEPKLRTRDQLAWLRRLRADHDNLHAAVRTAIGDGETLTALRFVAALGWYWWLAGHRAEGADLAEEAGALPGAADHPTRAEAQAVASLCVIDGNRSFGTIKDWIAEAVRLSSTVEKPSVALRVIGPLHVMITTRDPAAQVDTFNDLIHDDDPWARATGYLLRAHARLNTGTDDAAARQDMLAARTDFDALGERWGLATSESILAEHASRSGDHEEALRRWDDALRHLDELGAREDLPQLRAKLAHELWLHGREEEARAALDRAVREAEAVGSGEALAIALVVQADLLRRVGDLTGAEASLARADQALRTAYPSPQLGAVAGSSRGTLFLVRGDAAAARPHLEEALELALVSADAPVVGQTLISVAGLRLAEGCPADAAALLGAAAAVRGGPDYSVPERSTVEEATRAALGEAEFAEAYRRGQADRSADDLRRLTRA